MTNFLTEHPNEETLERFLLNRSQGEELEALETHILGCESCVTRLESLELQIGELTTALRLSEEARIQRELTGTKPSFGQRWFSMSSLSWAGAACAALAIGLAIAPHTLTRHSPSAAQVTEGDLSGCSASGADTLASCRGSETAVFPIDHPLNLRLDTTDIPQGKVEAQVVMGNGSEIWQGHADVNNERAEVKLPGIAKAGPYFLRFYAQAGGPDRELLREFRFEVR